MGHPGPFLSIFCTEHGPCGEVDKAFTQGYASSGGCLCGENMPRNADFFISFPIKDAVRTTYHLLSPQAWHPWGNGWGISSLQRNRAEEMGPLIPQESPDQGPDFWVTLVLLAVLSTLLIFQGSTQVSSNLHFLGNLFQLPLTPITCSLATRSHSPDPWYCTMVCLSSLISVSLANS